MTPVFSWLESTAFSVWMRESPSVFAFPAVLCLHAIGMAVVVGVQTGISLRILGVAREIPLGELRGFVPLMWAGFWLNAASGVALLIAYPTKAFTNPLFYLKLFFIALALRLVAIIGGHLFDNPGVVAVPGRYDSRWLAGAALACWAGAITSGRFLAYTYSRLLADW